MTGDAKTIITLAVIFAAFIGFCLGRYTPDIPKHKEVKTSDERVKATQGLGD